MPGVNPTVDSYWDSVILDDLLVFLNITGSPSRLTVVRRSATAWRYQDDGATVGGARGGTATVSVRSVSVDTTNSPTSGVVGEYEPVGGLGGDGPRPILRGQTAGSPAGHFPHHCPPGAAASDPGGAGPGRRLGLGPALPAGGFSQFFPLGPVLPDVAGVRWESLGGLSTAFCYSLLIAQSKFVF